VSKTALVSSAQEQNTVVSPERERNERQKEPCTALTDVIQDIADEDTAVKNDLDELHKQTFVSENTSESTFSPLPVTANTSVADCSQQCTSVADCSQQSSDDSSQPFVNTDFSTENRPQEYPSSLAVEIAESPETVTAHAAVILDSHVAVEHTVNADGVAAVDSAKICVPNLGDILVESFTSSTAPKQITSTEASIGQQSATQNIAAVTTCQLSSDHGMLQMCSSTV
jgi:hypothetical protein